MKIHNSVGKNCTNNEIDVLVVRHLLKSTPYTNNDLVTSIVKYQEGYLMQGGSSFSSRSASGQIYPFDNTFKTLVGLSWSPDYYVLQPGVELTLSSLQLVKEMSDRFYACTSKTTNISSGYRGPGKQAQAMFDKITFYPLNTGTGVDAVRNEYLNKNLVDQVLNKYKEVKGGYTNLVGKTGDFSRFEKEAVVAMTRIIEQQVASGQYVSKHLYNSAFDVIKTGFTPTDCQFYKTIANEANYSMINEGDPPHLHFQRM